MIKYLRTTHFLTKANKIGHYRNLKVWNQIPQVFSGLVHYLDPVKEMSLEEIKRQIAHYGIDFPTENDVNRFTDDNVLVGAL